MIMTLPSVPSFPVEANLSSARRSTILVRAKLTFPTLLKDLASQLSNVFMLIIRELVALEVGLVRQTLHPLDCC